MGVTGFAGGPVVLARLLCPADGPVSASAGSAFPLSSSFSFGPRHEQAFFPLFRFFCRFG